ncbi:ATP synthase subunit I [Paenibacillus monticola]|uniref:ATP synthase subunit I n=1 Tax=Paenibacillus monticola TaxID=2666075 RepID=A0A7X2H6C5_9BACL|nr:ATP synthase subunit I [Paenibacillus monticola]MRN54245.1 ATP synthase subunit I [Paenibacillus monticola]
MDNMTPVINTVTKLTLALMVGLLIGWALHHETRDVTLGMTLGLVAGLANFRYLAVKVRRVTQSIASNKGNAFSLGFVTRICFAILVTMFAVKINLSLGATILGLFIPQLLAIPTGIYLGIRNKL